MKIQIGSGSSFIRPNEIIISDKGREVIVDLPLDQSNSVRIEEIGHQYSEITHEIESLVIRPFEPSFAVMFKDGRSIRIGIESKDVGVICYSGTSPSEVTRISIPQKVIQIAQEG